MDSRAQALAILAAFVVIFGFVSFLVTGAIGRVHPAPKVASVPTASSPAAVVCTGSELAISGAVNDCVTANIHNVCSVHGHRLDAAMILTGASDEYFLDVEVDGNYNGPGIYGLTAWPHPALDTNDLVAKVAISGVRSGAVWHSVSGELSVNADGEAGFTVGTLDSVDGSQPALFLEGPWGCAPSSSPSPTASA